MFLGPERNRQRQDDEPGRVRRHTMSARMHCDLVVEPEFVVNRDQHAMEKPPGRAPAGGPGAHQPDMLILDAHLDLAMNAIEWNRDLVPPHRRDPQSRTGPLRQTRPRTRHRVPAGDAAGPGRAVRRDADRPLRGHRQPAPRLALSRPGMGHDAGAARLVPGHGRARRTGAGSRPGLARRAPAGVGIAGAGPACRIRAEPRRGRFESSRSRTSSAPTHRGSAPSARRTTARASTRRAPTRTAGWARPAGSCSARWSGSTSSST